MAHFIHNLMAIYTERFILFSVHIFLIRRSNTLINFLLLGFFPDLRRINYII